MKIEQFYLRDKANLCTLISKEENQRSSEDYVIFFHGLLSTKVEKEFLFSKIARELLKNYHVTAVQFDLAGHGDSTGVLEAYGLRDWIHDASKIVEYIASLGGTKIHLVGTGIGSIIMLRVTELLRDKSALVNSHVLISPTLDFQGFMKSLESVKSEVPEIVDIEEFLLASTPDASDSMLDPAPIFQNKSLHDFLIQLGAFSYDNIVASINRRLVCEIEGFSLMEELNPQIPTLIVQGNENCWFKDQSDRDNIQVSIISGDNARLPNHPIRQNDITDSILNFYNNFLEKI